MYFEIPQASSDLLLPSANLPRKAKLAWPGLACHVSRCVFLKGLEEFHNILF